MKKCFLILNLIVFSSFIMAQSTNCDSLIKVLGQTKKENRIQILNKLTVCYLNISLLEAKSYAIQACQQIGNDKNIETALAYHNCGLVYYYLGNIDSAEINYRKSIDINKQIDNQSQIIKSLSNIGILHIETGHNDSALYYYEYSMKIAEQLNDKRGIARSYSNIATVYDKEGMSGKALLYHEKALRIYRSINEVEAIITNYSKH